MGPFDLRVQGEIGTAFYIIASGQAAWKQKKLRGRERSLEREVQVLIDGKPVRTLPGSLQILRQIVIAKIEYAKLKLELPLQAWPFWRARTLVRGQFFESPCRHFLGVAA